MIRPDAVLVLALASSLLGCGDKTDPAEDDTSAAADTDDTDYTGPCNEDLDCLTGPCNGFTIETDYASSYTCVWTLLAQELPEAAQLVGSEDPGGDSPRRTLLVTGFDDRSVSMQDYGYINGSGSYSNAPVHCGLKPADFFADCLATEGAADSACWRPSGWTAGCSTETTCPEKGGKNQAPHSGRSRLHPIPLGACPPSPVSSAASCRPPCWWPPQSPPPSPPAPPPPWS